MKTLLNIIASRSALGGPERQIFGLAQIFRKEKHLFEQIFVSFSENGNGQEFIDELTKSGFQAFLLKNDTPHLWKALREIIQVIRENKVDLLVLHGAKPRLLGWIAGRKTGVPVLGVSHGWTGEDWKVRIYDRIDKWVHKRMDHVIGVSQGQVEKILKIGTPEKRVSVIHNAVQMERFEQVPDLEYRRKLEYRFQHLVQPPRFILGGVGRLSPEKGFDILLQAFASLPQEVGLVLFGDGFLRDALQQKANELGIANRVVFAGFTTELDHYMPHFDVFVQSSHTEGLPCVLLEAMGAQTAVVATEVGGTNEVVVEGETGLMVPSNDPTRLAEAIRTVLANEELRKKMGIQGRKRVEEYFTFEAQALAYKKLIDQFLLKP